MGEKMVKNKTIKGKKKALVLLISAILIVSIAGIAYAWFISRDSAKITHTLEGLNDNETKGVKITQNSPENQLFVPGATISHTIKFDNTASYDQFIRVKIGCKWSDDKVIVDEKEVGSNDSLLNLNLNLGDLNENSWFELGDYYYYIGRVSSNNSTSDLLQGVKLSEDIGSEYIGKDYEIDVDVEAVQVKEGGHKAWSELDSESDLFEKLDNLSKNISQ